MSTQKQKKLFNETVAIVKQSAGHEIRYVHIGATAGGAKLDGVVSTAIRLGIGLYGYNPLPDTDPVHEKLMKLRPALTFKTKLAAEKKIKKGCHISYNCTYTAPRDMTIGVLPLGYYEGIDRRLSNKGVVGYKGTDVPILGRVCMNITVIGLPDTGAKRLDDVEVISADTTKKNSVAAMAKLCKTIPYDVLVHLNERVRRVVM